MSLRHRDTVIERAFNTSGFMLIVAAGFRWLAPPNPPPPDVDLSFEIAMSKWVPVGAVVIAAIASFILVRRYLWVKQVLTHGTTIQGIVEDVDVYEREASHSDNAPAFQRSIIRSYYPTIRYTVQGTERTVRLRLPLSPSVYQIFKGKETELVLLESAPDKPLLRAVYLGRA
jgi:hypothetical protein